MSSYSDSAAGASSPASPALGLFAFGRFALGLALGCFTCTLGLEVFLGRGRDHVDDQRLGIGHQRDAVGQRERTGGELCADPGALDRHGEVFGDGLHVGLDGDGVRILGDQGAGGRLALDDDVDLDGDLLAAAHDQQVGMGDAATDRVQGERLGQRELLGALDVEGEHRVRAGVAQHRGEVVGVEFEMLGITAVAVEDRDDLAVAAGAARCALAGFLANRSGEIVRRVLGHRVLLLCRVSSTARA